MFGLILAMLYVAFSMVTSGSTAEVAFASTMPFLWYWHCIFACIFAGIVSIIFVIGLGATIFGDDAETKGIGIAAMFVGTPLLLIIGALGSVLFLGGTYCVWSSIAMDPETGGAAEFALWNIPLFVVGCVLYGIGALRQISARRSISTKSD
jgi:hypothetical protein